MRSRSSDAELSVECGFVAGVVFRKRDRIMFREDKITQIAAEFLKRAGGRMPYIKLLKLLYLADREKLLRWGVPMTYDVWCKMKRGPVLSRTYDLIKGNGGDIWPEHISKDKYDVLLTSDPGAGTLSKADRNIISDVDEKYGHQDWEDVVNATHDLPEWEEPCSAVDELTYRTVLLVEGYSEQRIDAIIKGIEERTEASQILARLE
jgi:uncharacterized phage-associated protein